MEVTAWFEAGVVLAWPRRGLNKVLIYNAFCAARANVREPEALFS